MMRTLPYQIGKILVIPQRNEIVRRKERIRIESQVMLVLNYLVEHRHRIVDRQELFDKLWPGIVVSEDALNRCIYQARKAIDDTSDQKVISTIRNKGYHFTGSVDISPPNQNKKSGIKRPFMKTATNGLAFLGALCLLVVIFCLVVTSG